TRYHEAFYPHIIGAPDVILAPSRFDPCGLTQLHGLKYGTLPLVRRTGGLADTVSDSSLENLADGIASGFVFEDSNAWSLLR
ncbi:starch synthase, partial [Klebsiella pneumoniae]|nr:starch synthase [Klebsiella pneumoniae]